MSLHDSMKVTYRHFKCFKHNLCIPSIGLGMPIIFMLHDIGVNVGRHISQSHAGGHVMGCQRWLTIYGGGCEFK